MGHQEVSRLQRQAWTDGAQREALGEENELGRIRRRGKFTLSSIHSRQPQHHGWGWATLQTFAGSLHRPGLPDWDQPEQHLLLPGARYCHLQYNWDSAP